MKTKTLAIITAIILLVGIVTAGFVSAERIIDNATGIYIEDFVAGSTVQANFSYDYLNRPGNIEPSPLIFRINITSSDGANYPVWKGDFEMNGSIERCQFNIFGMCFFEKIIPFNCSEESSLTINHPLGAETVYPEDGTFYCYNPEGDLKLDRHDEIYLNITSNPALWPGQYTLSAELYYLTDTYPPVVNILNNEDFENIYYRSGKYVEVIAEIEDINLYNYNAKIITPTKNYSFYKELIEDNKYRFFFQELSDEIEEGNWEINVTAQDINGNLGYDNITLMIDETPPEIELIEPVDIVSEEFSIKFNVIDERAGVDNESVQVRLREIVNGQICPETGGVIGEGNFSCITTPWINLTLVNDLFEVDINTTGLNLTSGEYWLDAIASDVLGNKAEWIA